MNPWSDETIHALRDAILRDIQQMEDADDVDFGRALVEVITQLVAERQALRDHLGYLLARFQAVRSEDHDAQTVAYAAYLSVQEYRQLKAALPEEEQR